MPLNITAATDSIGHFNLMPVYGISIISKRLILFVLTLFFITGLNVHSMLKHHTLVLTLAAVERIEERILFHLHRTDSVDVQGKYKVDN